MGTPFVSDATGTFATANDEVAKWLEAWQTASAARFADVEDALLGMDNLLQSLEHARNRWGQVKPSPERAQTHRDTRAALDDLILCLTDLMTAVERRDLEQIRVLSRAVESAGDRFAKPVGQLR